MHWRIVKHFYNAVSFKYTFDIHIITVIPLVYSFAFLHTHSTTIQMLFF